MTDTQQVEKILQQIGLHDYFDWVRVLNREHKKGDVTREIIYKRKDSPIAQTYTIKERLRIAISEIAEDMKISSFHEIES